MLSSTPQFVLSLVFLSVVDGKETVERKYLQMLCGSFLNDGLHHYQSSSIDQPRKYHSEKSAQHAAEELLAPAQVGSTITKLEYIANVLRFSSTNSDAKRWNQYRLVVTGFYSRDEVQHVASF